MLFTQSTLLAVLAATAIAAPASNDNFSVLKREEAEKSIPDEIPAPPKGRCALLTYSATILPIGGKPTSNSGQGIGPSEVGDPSAGVINSDKEIVGPFVKVEPQSPGFAATIELDSDKVDDAGTVEMTAEYIATGEKDWDVNWKYNDYDYTCDGNKCKDYNLYTGVFGAYSVHVGTFSC